MDNIASYGFKASNGVRKSRGYSTKILVYGGFSAMGMLANRRIPGLARNWLILIEEGSNPTKESGLCVEGRNA
jgi:hypothetical protein